MKISKRDDFSASIKRFLAERVGFRCSNPYCQALTSGPQISTSKSVNIGVAAHITAAAQGGPRYDPALSPDERSSIANGIWLCQNCAKLIDNDHTRYSVGKLRQWKKLAENKALNSVGKAIHIVEKDFEFINKDLSSSDLESDTYQNLLQFHMGSGQELDELRKLESINREWVLAVGGGPFLRLLHAFEEIIYPTARLELGRTLLYTINNIGARRNATGRALLQICCDLESHQFFQLNWKLRRMLARVVGDILGNRLGISEGTIVGSFCERIVESSKGIQFLAEAATEHTAAAITIGDDRLRSLLFSTNPQARWQLLRRWPIVSPVISEGVDLEDIMEVTDVGIKRMLILTRLLLYRSSTKSLKNLLGRLKEDLFGKDPEGADFRFYNAVHVWVSYYTALEDPLVKAQAAEILNIDDAISLCNWKVKKSEFIVEQLVQSLELDTIKRDLLNAEGNYLPHPKRFSEGRYGYTRYYVNRIINELPLDLLTELLYKLLNCADEGIRWAVSAEVPNWWVRVHDKEQSISLIVRLLHDNHPWVVREALQQLSKNPYVSHTIGVNQIIQYADESIDIARERGWDVGELNSAKMRIAAQSFSI